MSDFNSRTHAIEECVLKDVRVELWVNSVTSGVMCSIKMNIISNVNVVVSKLNLIDKLKI